MHPDRPCDFAGNVTGPVFGQRTLGYDTRVLVDVYGEISMRHRWRRSADAHHSIQRRPSTFGYFGRNRYQVLVE